MALEPHPQSTGFINGHQYATVRHNMAIFDVIKTAAKVAQEAGKIELYGQILEVYEKLLEQQKRIADLEEENGNLKKQLEMEDALIFERNAYWIGGDDKKEGPFCTKCKDAEGKLIRMRVGKYHFGWALCPGCETVTPDMR